MNDVLVAMALAATHCATDASRMMSACLDKRRHCRISALRWQVDRRTTVHQCRLTDSWMTNNPLKAVQRRQMAPCLRCGSASLGCSNWTDAWPPDAPSVSLGSRRCRIAGTGSGVKHSDTTAIWQNKQTSRLRIHAGPSGFEASARPPDCSFSDDKLASCLINRARRSAVHILWQQAIIESSRAVVTRSHLLLVREVTLHVSSNPNTDLNSNPSSV